MNGQMHGNIKDSFHKFKVYFLICESLFLIHFNQICLSERMIKKLQLNLLNYPLSKALVIFNKILFCPSCLVEPVMYYCS